MGHRARATIKVKVEILDADERLFPDMSSTVYFLPDESQTREDLPERRLFCPSEAVVADANGASHVWLVDDHQRVRRVAVQAGEANDGRTEILGGLTGSERVVLRPPAELREGQLVNVAE
jgi:multidrug efflux pump subunit AcrA (membrane-fusion protein)